MWTADRWESFQQPYGRRDCNTLRQKRLINVPLAHRAAYVAGTPLYNSKNLHADKFFVGGDDRENAVDEQMWCLQDLKNQSDGVLTAGHR